MVTPKTFLEKRVLITGANGFIGARLAEDLCAEGAQVYAAVSPQSKCENLNTKLENLHVLRGEIQKFGDVQALIQESQPHIIYHMASYGNHPQHYQGSKPQERLRIMQTNMIGTGNLLAACHGLDFECLINTGSAFGEYGPGTEPMREGQRLKPNSFYGASKAGATFLCNVFGQIEKKRVITLRPFYVYGPGEWEYRFIPVVIAKCLSGQELELTSLNETKSFVFIDDCLEAYKLAYLRDTEGVEALNIGSEEENSLGEVIKLVEDYLGKKVNFTEGSYKQKQWKSHCWKANLDLTKKTLGWQPRTSLQEGIKKTADWVRLKQQQKTS